MNNLDNYKNQLEQFSPITYENILYLVNEGEIKVKKIKKNELLLLEGQISKDIYFILKGALRQYSFNKGEEVNFLFYFENDFVFDHSSYLTDMPSIYCIRAIEDCLTLCITKDILTGLWFSSLDWLKLYNRINETAIVRLYKRNEVLLTLSPEERYLKLLEVHPQLMERVPLAKIATFLGITVPSLSRIRKRITTLPLRNLT